MAIKPITEILGGVTRFGQLTFIHEVAAKPDSNKRRAAFRCDCGNVLESLCRPVVIGRTKSCGCLKTKRLTAVSTTHGMSKVAPEYYVWCSMKQRCTNPRVRNWLDYGGRGISVCAKWLTSFESFLADMGERPSPTHSLDRINNDGNYEPENCRWADLGEQVRNRRSNIVVEYHGCPMVLADAAKLTGVKYSTARMRLKKGWTVDRALTP